MENRKLDEYQMKLYRLLASYAQNAGMPLQKALRDVLGDLRIVAKECKLDFQMAIDNFDGDIVDDAIMMHLVENKS